MQTNPLKPANQTRTPSHLSCAAALVFVGLATASASALPTNVTWSAEASVRESYDSDVFIEDKTPAPASVAAAQAAGLHPVEADKGSFVTAILPKIGIDYKPCPAFNLSVGYAPDIEFFHSADSEDYVAHRTTFNFGGKEGDTSWDLANTATYIDGSTTGPTFARPDDIPAIGGIPLRDRRAAFIYRSNFKLTQTFGKWMIRPVASAYVHDFKTDLRVTPSGAPYVYENYIDRQDISGGLDVGYEVANNLRVLMGYRYGRQDQFKSVMSNGAPTNSPYGNTYNRILFGAEGAPFDWLKLAILAGPDIRRFDHEVPGFNPHQVICYVDASVTLLPTKQDSIALAAKRFEQPAFSSFSMYEDITYDLAWKHKFDDHWATSAGFKIYAGDWQTPVNRNDWIYTPSAGLAYAYDKHLSAELNYSYDWVQNRVSTSAPGATYADGREFTRHIISLAVKYVF